MFSAVSDCAIPLSIWEKRLKIVAAVTRMSGLLAVLIMNFMVEK